MKFLTPDFFFDLSKFTHAALWKEGELAFSPLNRLKEYILSLDLGKIEIELSPSVYIKNRELVSIGKGTVIDPGVLIEGPCVIGENCTIRHGAFLREFTLLGNGCSIGHCTEIKHSILLDGAAATHFVYVGDSILGNQVNLGAGVKCANLRLDRALVAVGPLGNKIQTGLKKFGALVGDRAQIGCNSVMNPGTLIGKGVACHPLSNLKGMVVEGKQDV